MDAYSYPYAVSFYACKVLRYVLGKSWLICPAGTNIVSGTETVCFSRAIQPDQGRSSEERYIFKAHPDRRTQIRVKAERYRKITLCCVYFWFCRSTLSKTTIPCKQGPYKALNRRVHFWKRISAKIVVRVHFWKSNFRKNVLHLYFWKSKLKINICRVYFSWLLHCTPLNLRVIENYNLHKHEYCQKMLLY